MWQAYVTEKRANVLRVIVDVHRPLSNLIYCEVEAVSRCSPPAPPKRTTTDDSTPSEIHTSKALRAIEKLNGLLTLSDTLRAYTPFMICMVATTTIAYLSACRHVLRSRALKLARERIRLNMGVLKALGECWPLGKRTYSEVGVIAREILCLTDCEIPLPVSNPSQDTLPLCTVPLGIDFDFEIDSIDFTDFDNTNLRMDST